MYILNNKLLNLANKIYNMRNIFFILTLLFFFSFLQSCCITATCPGLADVELNEEEYNINS